MMNYLHDASLTKSVNSMVSARFSELLTTSHSSETDPVIVEGTGEGDSSLYFVAFHQRDIVRLAIFIDLPSAWLFYEAVSNDWAKVLIDKTKFQPSTAADYGATNYIRRCKDDANVRDPTPLCDVPYAVAFHENTNVRMAVMTDLPSARAFYNAISKNWAKVLMDRSKFRPPATVAFHGVGKFVEQCTTEIFNDNDRTPLIYAPLVVAFHQVDAVHAAFFPAERQHSAEAFYDAVPQDKAKVLLDRSQIEPLTLAVHGGRNFVRQCESEVHRSQSFAPFNFTGSPYFIAFHQNDAVKVAACVDEDSASAFYHSISKEWAKVLVKRNRSGNIRLQTHGHARFVNECEDEAVKLGLK
ncbi:hypothetical protein E1B28_013259 [Marasmius oreades]|uniref:Uncharacterized protein n=1 Tax=Marasmius oreades TaxID=181124 RepID=A0A9P7RP89_9AGAR|nr:uncharacterized protein E1B28_013259 [Marasmius oreades]KAG7087281.1 hypothetical protein E1B28_013259 [Marasmius oreades]